MRKSRYTDEQMVKILRETDRSPVAEVAKKHGVSEQTIYVWRKRFGDDDGGRHEALCGARAGEQSAEEAGRRARSRDRGDEGDRGKKMVSAPASTAAGRVRIDARSLAATRVRAPPDGTLGAALRSSKATKDRAPAVERMRELAGAVPALRLSPDPHLPRPRRPRDEPRSRVSPVAAARAPGAAEAAAPARRGESAEADCRRRGRTRSGRTTSSSTRARTASS